jgi:putative tryptophan/tyrosine transport system substrate-binding protein
MTKLVFSSVLLALFLPAVAGAQLSTTTRRIGYLFTGFQPPKEFLQAMNQLGYIEGKNISFDYRATEGREERLPQLASELVRRKVDVIVAPGSAAGLAAKKATSTVPIVYLAGC